MATRQRFYVRRQCAWCYRLADEAGHYSIQSARRVSASHGICPGCKVLLLAEVQAHSPSLSGGMERGDGRGFATPALAAPTL